MNSIKQNFESAFLVCALVIVSVLLIWVRIASVRATYQFVSTQKEVQILEQEVSLLRGKWLALTSTQNLERHAKTLELGAPRTNQIVRAPWVSSKPFAIESSNKKNMSGVTNGRK